MWSNYILWTYVLELSEEKFIFIIDEWEYTTQSGEQVLLENSSRKALIIAEREKSFVVVNVLGDVEGNLFDVTDQTLEELAEMFDFSVIP